MSIKKLINLITVAFFCAPAAVSAACPVTAESFDSASTTIDPIEGKWVLIQAWTLDCVQCEKQKPTLSELDSTYSNFDVFALSLDGAQQYDAVVERINSKNYSMSHYLSDIPQFREQMESCFQQPFIGTPTYILYSPAKKLMAVRTGPLDLKALPAQLKLAKN